MISYNEPEITSLRSIALDRAEIDVKVLHEYQNHGTISGNKWWKLRDNLKQARQHSSGTILTFGGAFSNHIYATAAAASEAGLNSIGIIRGEEVDNKTLTFARSRGMRLEFVSRSDYRKRAEPAFHDWLTDKFGSHYLVPEGGTNQYAINACEDWGRKLMQYEFDQLFVPVGTTGTVAGLIRGIGGERKVVGVPVLKNDGHVEEAIETWVGKEATNWRLLNDYHFGGYAKAPDELLEFCTSFRVQHEIVIEPVYTGKLFWALFDQVNRGLIKRGSTVMVIHTGGLQYLP